MNFWVIMILLAGAFAMQYVMGIYQIGNFKKAYGPLRRMGRVAIGRCSGRVRAGVIVMFAIDEEGTILRVEKMQGVTAFAKFKELKGFVGKNISSLEDSDTLKLNSQLKKAVLNARDNYNTIINGGEVEQNPSPFQKIGLATKKVLASSEK